MIYDDFPACLTRYAWLVAAAERDLSALFDDPAPHYCKACGEAVTRPGWDAHRREHVRQLRQTVQQRKREQVKLLRQVNRLRAESRAVA